MSCDGKVLLGVFMGLSIGFAGGVLAGSRYSDLRWKEVVFSEQVERHGCLLRDVETSGGRVINVSCELPDGTIVKKY